jgi:tetratricopeptide (TPR) repeat protein
MKYLIFFIALNTCFYYFSQSGSYYGNPSDASELCGIRVQATNSFNSNQEAQKALDKIIAVTGISKRFALYQCSGINNCEAITFRGIRYIFYDPNFMKSITATAGSWTNLSILAHEVGHHVNAHSLDWLALASGEIQGITLEQKRQQEIEADEFSGFVLAKLGATLIQAQAAIKLASDEGDDTYSTHPSRSKRISAIERGYNQAKGLTTKPYATVSLTAEDYFYLAYNSDKNDVKISNYTKCLQINSGIITAYVNRGNVYKDEKRYTEALSDFDKVIELAINSKSQNFKNYLDDGYRGKGRCYRQMIYINENDADYYHQKAITEFTNAVNTEPNAINYLARANIYSDRLYKTEANSLERTSMANKSLSDYNAAARLDPVDPDIYHYRGNLFDFYLEDKNAALNDYKKFAELDPSKSIAYENQGRINYELENFEISIQNYTKSISIFPDGMSYFKRAESYIALEKYKEAISDFTKAIYISKDTTNESWAVVDYNIIDIYWGRAYCYEKLNNYSLAISDYSKIIEISKDEPSAVHYIKRAKNYGELKKNDLAIADFNKAILIDPSIPESYHSRGYFYQFTLGKDEKALEDYNKAISIDKEYLPSYYNRGIIFSSSDNPEKTISDFTKFIENSDEQDADAYFFRGLALNDLENYLAAIEDFDLAIELSSENDDYYNNRALSKYYLGQYNDALNDLNTSIEISQNNHLAYNNRGLVYDELEKYDLAILDYSKAIQIKPNFVRAYINRGSTKDELGQFQQAILDYNKAIELDPKSFNAYINRGVTKTNLKQYQQAILDYNRAIELNPNLGIAYSNRGSAKFNTNNKIGACADWKKAVELGYDYVQSLIDDNCK